MTDYYDNILGDLANDIKALGADLRYNTGNQLLNAQNEEIRGERTTVSQIPLRRKEISFLSIPKN